MPAYKAGGPIRSVYNLIESIYDKYDFYVITSNLDIDNAILNGVEFNSWTKQGKANVLYLTKENQTKVRFNKEVESVKPSHIYLNSLFSLKFTLLPLLLFRKNYKIVLAPRGMLGAESLAIKALKKKVFLSVAKFFGLYKNVLWHVSSKIEGGEVRKAFGSDVTIKVASNLTLVPNELNLLSKEAGKIKLLMVGRVVPIKNIHFFLEELKGLSLNSEVKISIVGLIEDEDYYQKCLSLVKDIPNNIQVVFLGALPPFEVASLYQSHHLLVSTSLNENYGHSIAEALTHGRPILVSNNTPWKNLKKLKIGANLNLEIGLFGKELQKFIDLECTHFQELQKRAKDYALTELKSKNSIKKSIALFSPDVAK